MNFWVLRLVSSLEWVNTAQVWDAVLVTVGDEKRFLDAFASRVVPTRPTEFNDWDRSVNRLFNSQFYGLYFSDKKWFSQTILEGYWLFRHEGRINDDVHATGVRLDTKWRNWDANLETMVQLGDFGGLDHFAYAGHIEGGYSWPEFHKARVALAYNIGSGDDNAADGNHGTLDNLYPLNHAYYGYMDFFSLQNIHNLEAVFSLTPYKIFDVRLAVQNFWHL